MITPLRIASWLILGFVCVHAVGAQTTRPAPPVTGSPASRPPSERQEIRAQLIPRRYTTISAEIAAKIQHIPVLEGGSFRSGQTLVQFDCILQEAQVKKAQAEVDSAEQTLKSNQRMSELNAISRLELELSRSALTKAQAELWGSKAVVDKCLVQAPFAGRVTEQRAREQQFVQMGQPLLDIIDDSVLELDFLVPSTWLSWLRVGTVFQVQIDETRKTYPARFIRVGAKVDPVSQSIKVVGAIQGHYGELMAGMSGRVHIVVP